MSLQPITTGAPFDQGPTKASVVIDQIVSAVNAAVKAVPVINFGAAVDGITDDSVAFQNAQNFANVTGGKVTIPAGTLICAGVFWDAGVTIEGAGEGATLLKLKAGANKAILITRGFSSLTGGGTSGGPNGFVLRDLSMDANKAQNSSGFCTQIYGFGYRMSNVNMRNAATTCLYSEWGSDPNAIAPDNCEARLVNVKTHDGVTGGIDFQGPHDSQFVNVISYLNGSGFGVRTSGNGNGAQFINCHAWGLGQLWAWELLAGGCDLVNCQGEGAGTSPTTGGQVLIGANDCSVVGGQYFAAGANSGLVRGISVGDSTHTNVAGTHIDTKVTSCLSGAVDFNSDGGSRVVVTVYQASGAVWLGTPNAQTEYQFTHTGGAATGGGSLFASVTTSKLTVLATAGTMGTAPLVAGKAQVFTSAITNNSQVFVTMTTPGGTVGALCVKNIGGTDRLAANWFFVSSAKTDGTLQNADTSTFNWFIVEPS